MSGKPSEVYRVCQQCNNAFFAYEHLVAIGKAKYCSRKCYELSKRKETEIGKVCSKCQILKSLDQFTKRKRNGTNLCGCYCKECRVEIQSMRGRTPHARWMMAKSRATKKFGSDWWAVVEDEYTSLISQPCHYCKGPLNDSGVGLDRKSNTTGYTSDNVVPCCRQCNIVKNNFFTYEEMMLLAPVLERIRQGRIV